MLVRHTDPARFLQHAGRFLEVDEVENNLVLGISSWLATHPEQAERSPYFFVVENRGTVEAAAIMTPPYRLLVSRSQAQFLSPILEHLVCKRISLPGVNGPAEASKTFAQLWAERTDGAFHLNCSLRLYKLTNVIPPRPVDGRCRLASEEVQSTIIKWVHDFSAEINEPGGVESAQKLSHELLADQRLYVWDDKGLRSMAAWSGPTQHGARINFVYTPPEYRGRGYASACVAALSQIMLDSGKRFCCLYTDLSNPVSNRIYQCIGYHPACDFAEYDFD
jgi:predicted GNAT family acetyltransferase